MQEPIDLTSLVPESITTIPEIVRYLGETVDRHPRAYWSVPRHLHGQAVVYLTVRGWSFCLLNGRTVESLNPTGNVPATALKRGAVASDRLAVCLACDRYQDGKCLACGCSVEAKVQTHTAACPLARW